jgi:hypothetical protein
MSRRAVVLQEPFGHYDLLWLTGLATRTQIEADDNSHQRRAVRPLKLGVRMENSAELARRLSPDRSALLVHLPCKPNLARQPCYRVHERGLFRVRD